MRVLAVANHKGGVGKSSCVVALGALAAESGRRVLVVDLDAGGTASYWLRVSDGGQDALLSMYVDGGVLAARPSPTVPGLDVAAASRALREPALADNPLAVLALRRALEAVAGDYDLAVIDTPPTVGVLTTSAIAAADMVLAPVEASLIALPGLVDALDAVRQVRKSAPPGPSALGVVITRADMRQVNARTVLDALRADENTGPLLLETVVRDRVSWRDAAAARVPVTLFDPTGDAADDARALWGEVGARLGVADGEA